MQILLFFNELSGDAQASSAEADAAVMQMVAAMREVSRLRPGAALVAPGLLGHLVGEGQTFGQWYVRRENRDLGRWVLGRLNQAPFQEIPMAEVEYIHNSLPAVGLGAADLHDGIAVSLASHPEWHAAEIRVVRQRLAEDITGEIVVLADEVEVRHASEPAHLVPSLEWITRDSLEFRRGHEIWAAREEVYPYLRFLPRVEELLLNLETALVRPASRELALINRAASEWDPTQKPVPLWRSMVTPEHEMRRKSGIFDFEDGGQLHTFDLHGRFTGNGFPGRVHFRLSPNERKIIIGHVGRKME